MTTWIIDPGHEGMSPGGLYLRQGKQSPSVPPGIYEGEFNRAVAFHLQGKCNESKIPSVITAPGAINVSLQQRVGYANKLHAVTGDCVFLSIHANASSRSGWGKPHGYTILHAPRGSKASRDLAERINRSMRATTTASRGVRTARFTVLTKTSCPAVLVECGFMDNIGDAQYMASGEGRYEIATAIWRAMVEFDRSID